MPSKNYFALITGASSGIGRAIAIELASHDISLVLLGRNPERLERTKSECLMMASEAINVLTVLGDLRDDEYIQRVVNTIEQHVVSLNYLIHAAGVNVKANLLEKPDLRDIEALIQTNLISVMKLTQLCVPSILQSSQNRNIIFISSQSGKNTYSSGAAYCASKFGLQGYSQCVFEDLREEHVKITSICPGYVATPMISNRSQLNVKKMIDPNDIAKLVWNLCNWPISSCPTNIDLRPQYSCK
ncbi:hypothetical protein GEMRC1_008198 [Eukaryota sp. GEM-RC1]